MSASIPLGERLTLIAATAAATWFVMSLYNEPKPQPADRAAYGASEAVYVANHCERIGRTRPGCPVGVEADANAAADRSCGSDPACVV